MCVSLLFRDLLLFILVICMLKCLFASKFFLNARRKLDSQNAYRTNRLRIVIRFGFFSLQFSCPFGFFSHSLFKVIILSPHTNPGFMAHKYIHLSDVSSKIAGQFHFNMSSDEIELEKFFFHPMAAAILWHSILARRSVYVCSHRQQ